MVAIIPSYPWYTRIEDASLEQGDFFFGCPVLEPVLPDELKREQDSLQAVVKEYDVIVLSQSCDLIAGKLDSVLLCPVFPLEIAEQNYSALRSPKDKEAVRRGNVPGLYMVAACDVDGFVSPIRIASFRSVFSLPFNYIQRMAATTQPRLRLLPPYREHLAQAFARFIMRVGLPVDIPSFR